MEIDWPGLWKELVTASLKRGPEVLSKRYEIHARKGTERPDPLLDKVLVDLEPQDTVIDIGPGNGRWTIPLARIAKRVTAVEPTEVIVEILQENISKARLNNIDIINLTWEDSSVQPHDIVVCSHAMYSSLDFTGFINKIERNTKKRCYLAIRLPPADGILGELSLKIFGRRFDSPNAIIAFNALYSMGIYPNILVENSFINWVNSSIQEAFIRAKRHLHWKKNFEYDALIMDNYENRLKFINGSFIWPDGMRSALL